MKEPEEEAPPSVSGLSGQAVLSVDPPLTQLTVRELEALELMSGGYSNKDIAKILVISGHTVNDDTKKIYRKLGVHSRYGAAQIVNRQAFDPR